MKVVSIIIPAFNCAQTIEDTIESCIKNKNFLKEVIVVDDFSTDNSWAKLVELKEKLGNVLKIYKNESKGGNAARNLGFSKSTGDYIQWLDADDTISDTKLEMQVTDMLARGLDVSFSDCIFSYSRFSSIPDKYYKNQESSNFKNDIINDKWQPCHAYLLKRIVADAMHKIGGWNLSTVIAQDREYFTTIAMLNFKFGYTANCYVTYFLGNPSSVSKRANSVERSVKIAAILFQIFDKYKKSLSPRDRNDLVTNIVLNQFYGQTNLMTTKLTNINWNLIPGFRTKVKLFFTLLK